MELLIYGLGPTFVQFLLDRGVSMQTLLTTVMIGGALLAILSRLPTRRRVTFNSTRRQAVPVFVSPSQDEPLPTQPPQTPTDETMSWIATSKGEGSEVWELDDGEQQERHRKPGDESEVAFLKRRLEEEMRSKWQAQALILEPPAARLVGRVARIEAHDPEAARVALWLAFPDEDGNYQAVKLRGLVGDLSMVSEGDRLQVAATWRFGRLTITEVEVRIPVENIDEPMPEVKLPAPKTKDAAKQDGKLPTMAELDKQAREGGWGALNHSVYRFQVPVHITMAPKRRAKSFEGRAAEVQAICREVAEAEGLKVIALAAEGDHIHLLGIPNGTGGMPPTWQWSRWVGRWKALTSKRLKSLPGIEDFTWQTGYAITAVHGGRQGAEEALETVKRYVEVQGEQGEQGDDNYLPEGVPGDDSEV